MKYMFYILRSEWLLFFVLSSPSNASLVSMCERCNDSRTPAEHCSQTNEFVICRDDEPYCLTQITSTGNGLKVMKGCASEDTCLNKWWIETQNNPNCSSTLIVDESIPVGTTCTFCCHDPEQLSAYCNRNNIPDYLMHPESLYVTTECFDHYLGNCIADFPGGCGDLYIRAICPRTCQSCPYVTSECRDHYIGSCTDDFRDNCDDALIRAICPKTCGVCYQELTTLEQTSITLPPTTEETTSTTASTTVAPTSGSCMQCGEPEFSVPCSSMELLLDTPSPCMEPGKFLCMTDAATDSDGVTSIYKRCVNQPTCHTLWYLESSNQNVCRNFDSLTTDVSCHFCCIHDGCNTGTVPPEGTLYNGHL